MQTYFASTQRSSQEDLNHQARLATDHPVIDGVMRAVGGLVAVLNRNRQILTVNQGLLDSLGIENLDRILGLRPGEALACRYADEMDAGCGTSEHCMACGAAIAIVASLGSRRPVDRTCALSAMRNGNPIDLYFNVHAAPMEIDDETFVLLFLHDITAQQERAALERVFFHDLNNTITGLTNASELLRYSTPDEVKDIAGQINRLAHRVSSEVALQSHLCNKNSRAFALQFQKLTVEDIIGELKLLLTHHPAIRGKALEIENSAPGSILKTDHALLHRVLSNMLINAFEATHGYDMVRLNIDIDAQSIRFAVWNRASMSMAVASRVFQRNFSTKGELGRGLGTYSMKLIGEQLLEGKVYFQTSREAGTEFVLELPLSDADSTYEV